MSVMPSCRAAGQRTACCARRRGARGWWRAWRGTASARRFLLALPVAPGTGSMLMGTTDRGVDVHLPSDQPGRVSPGLQTCEHLCPHTTALPASEKPIEGLPRPVFRWNVPPRCPSPHPPANPIDQLSSMPRWPAQHRNRQQRLQHRPLAIRKIPSPHTEIITAQGTAQQPLLKHDLGSRGSRQPTPTTAAAGQTPPGARQRSVASNHRWWPAPGGGSARGRCPRGRRSARSPGACGS